MSILIVGSLAYDYVMDFPDSFKNHIMPKQLHILNVSFAVDKIEKNFGGCAGNIAYNVKLLGEEPIIFSSLGADAQDYLSHFKKYKIKNKYINISKQKNTASVYIITDKKDNQISAFYSGALKETTNKSINKIKEKIKLALISPTYKDNMIKYARECYENKILFVFDPGQQITEFKKKELQEMISKAKFVIGNDYEIKLMQKKTKWNISKMLNKTEVIIITLEEKGSKIITQNETINIDSCLLKKIEDPTGAGDAYRAGFFTAYIEGKDLKICGKYASLVAKYAIENYGTQNHFFTRKEIDKKLSNVKL
ncbi:carbohydrate kinase family protein [Candidatus Kuenenbacteria bacterium HGW-Kuenenbacteria-1]|uniref:Carbohydrate kinase family protein n=1 Tax=Candidatus Kuenenbacteria bacterium HGW-Kuenenbacteria-1 TaxID=2013812 RepID=A0A2N1UMN2_9BACT|nr:MAG: carbohydrate kinase family protein [Candidatus Kuenenbacteria bacterium HGW-Kuenenbacteria-1]